MWILFEGAFGGHALCSLIVNDEAGVLEVAGGEITRKRLETELAALRASQKLPWVETEPARALASSRRRSRCTGARHLAARRLRALAAAVPPASRRRRPR